MVFILPNMPRICTQPHAFENHAMWAGQTAGGIESPSSRLNTLPTPAANKHLAGGYISYFILMMDQIGLVRNVDKKQTNTLLVVTFHLDDGPNWSDQKR
jgi:hypothetical protein